MSNEGSPAASSSSRDAAFLDYRQTALNACSLETWPGDPIQVSSSDDTDTDTDTAMVVVKAVVPTCLGCYQLDEATGQRQGRLEMFAVPVVLTTASSSSSSSSTAISSGISTALSFGSSPPLVLLGADDKGDDKDGDDDDDDNCSGDDSVVPVASGVLDGKWFDPSATSDRGSRSRDTSLPQETFHGYYATAHASGQILVHDVVVSTAATAAAGTGSDADTGDDSRAASSNPFFQATLVGQSESPSTKDGLCLSLAWDNGHRHRGGGGGGNGGDACGGTLDTQIVSSYSDGHVAIHRVQAKKENHSGSNSSSRLEITLQHHWEAHTLFRGHAAEVWCANFLHQPNDGDTQQQQHLVATGGDEGTWKGWDLRVPLTRPIFQHADVFGAGVTVIAPHPRRQHIVVVGSYDETVALFDLRTHSSSSPSQPPRILHHSTSMGGGIWRCKWHPHDDSRLLVAAMHGGCRVVQYDNGVFDETAALLPLDDGALKIEQQFTMHKSMAYGVDWIWFGGDGTHNNRCEEDHSIEAAVSCSFYDRAMYLWNTKGTGE